MPPKQQTKKLNFQTTGLPWQASKADQEVSRNAQSLGILNPTTLKTRLKPAAKNLKAKYSSLSTAERLALAKKSMPHSEIVQVKDKNGNTVTDVNPQAGAMSGADPVGEFVVGTVGGNLGFGLGKLALSKMGQNSLSHWARNSLLNEAAGNLTTKMTTPLIEASKVPLEDGFAYRTFTPTYGGWVKDGKVYNRNYGLGDVRIQNGKYYSVRQAHLNNPDKLWWDTSGHNNGQVVQVTKEANTQTLQDAAKTGFNFDWGAFNKGYRLSDPIETNKVITYKRDPISGTMIPSMPGKIITNKQSPSEIFQMPNSSENFTYLNNTYTGFKGTYPKLNQHLQGEDAVKMFKEYGGTPIPEGSINGEQLRMYVNEARERYGLIGNTNISDEEIAQALYKHTNELGKGSAAINAQGEPQLLFRGDTKAYTKLQPRVSPEELYQQEGTMDNSLGTLFLGEMPKATGGDQGVAKYLNTAVATKAMPGTEPQIVFRPSQTGGSLEFDGKTWKGIYNYPSTMEKNTEMPVVVPKDASFLYSGKNGLYSVYKLPSRMATSSTNEINSFVVRTPAVRDMSLEMQVLEPAAPVQYADHFHWLTKNKPKLMEDKDGFPIISYKEKDASGLGSNSEQGVVRELYKDQYSQLLKEAEEQNQGLLFSRPKTILRREHNGYSYYALPNWNLKNAKHILPYDLRIPRDWSDSNIFRIAAPIGISLPFLNNLNNENNT